MPRRGGKKKKTRTHVPMTEEEVDAVPKSLVVRRTALGKDLRLLETELRAMMSPFTSLKLNESVKNKMKEIIATAENFGAKNLFLLYDRRGKAYLKAAVSPKGPTFTFRLVSFYLESDLVNALGSKSIGALGLDAPLCLVQAFSDHASPQVAQQLSGLFRGLFPDTRYFQTRRPKRMIVFFYDKGRDVVEVRNYKIERETVGMSATLAKILKGKEIDFSAVRDAGELLVSGTQDQESDKRKMKLNLLEIAPRLTLKLVKVEESMLAGEVLHHAFVRKSAEEVGNLRRAAAEKIQTKMKNKKIQKQNVALKEKARNEKAETKRRKYAEKSGSTENGVDAQPDFEEEASDNENANLLRPEKLGLNKKVKKIL